MDTTILNDTNLNPTEFFKVISAIILLIAYILSLRVNLIQYKKLRREVNDIKIVVKDTLELRKALMKPVEGAWKVKGDFSKYKNVFKTHYTTGEISFNWLPGNRHYDVTYIYSVREEKSEEDIITCYCKGTLPADINGNIPETGIKISLEILSRTSSLKNDKAISKHFELKDGKITESSSGLPTELEFKFENGDTIGKIIFTK